MKKVLAVVIAVAFISFGAVSSNAQVPNIQIYFDDLLQETQGFCEDHYLGEPDQLYVVCNNFNMFISTVEFAVEWGIPAGYLTYAGDAHLPGSLNLGTSLTNPAYPGVGEIPGGVTITYPLPQNGYNPFICMMINVVWICEACPPPGNGNFPIVVVPHQGTGVIQAIEWQTFRIVDGVGMTSLLCPEDVSTEETTWGAVKALYNN